MGAPQLNGNLPTSSKPQRTFQTSIMLLLTTLLVFSRTVYGQEWSERMVLDSQSRMEASSSAILGTDDSGRNRKTDPLNMRANGIEEQPMSFPFKELMRHRRLENGDFDDINELYRDTTILLPNASVVENVGGFDLELDFSNIECRNITIGDIQVTWTPPENQELIAQVELLDQGIICRVDYKFEYVLGTNGRGVVDVFTRGNNATASLIMQSPDFATQPPNALIVDSCEPSIVVYDLDFGEQRLRLVKLVLNALDKQLRKLVGREVGKFLCDEIEDLDDELTNVLGRVTEALGPYLGDVEEVDPLAAEKAMEVPEDLNLLSLSDPVTTLEIAVDTLLEKASGYFGNVVDDGNGGRDMNINLLIRRLLLDTDGGYTVDLQDMEGLQNGVLFEQTNLLGTIRFGITYATIFGLDSFTQFDELVAVGNYTLKTVFAIESIVLQVGAELELSPPESPNKKLVEKVKIELPLDNIRASASLLLAIDEGKLGSLPLGSLLNEDTILDCLLATAHNLEVSSLSVQPVDIGFPSLSGFQSPGISRILTDAADIMYTGFNQALFKALTNFMGTTAVTLLNSAMQEFWKHASCADLESPDMGTFIDFRDLLLPAETAKEYGTSGLEPYGGLASYIKEFVDTELLSVNSATGMLGINKEFIAPLTESAFGTRGSFALEDSLIDVNRRLEFNGLDANIEFKLSNIRVDNLDSMGEPLFLLDPVPEEGYLVNNSATIGTPPKALRFSGTLLVAVTSSESEIRNEVEIGLDLSSATLVITALIKIVAKEFLAFPIENLLDIDCLLSTLQPPKLDSRGIRTPDSDASLALRDLALSVKDFNFTVNCVECSSPSVKEIADLLSSPAARDDAAESARSVINFALSLAEGDSSFVQTLVDRKIVDAPKHCPHHPDYDPSASSVSYESFAIEDSDDSLGFLYATIAAIGCIIAGGLVISILVRFIVSRRNRKWLQTLSAERRLAIYSAQQKEKEKAREINESTSSMFRSQQLPWTARCLIPVIILGNIGLFLSGHLSKGGSVEIYLQIGGEQLVVDDFYTFSIAQSGIELWNAGGKELAILILLFSGAWPYTKQLITLVLWFLPPNVVSVAKRGSIFLWLDALAKWSMVDVFVMIISIVAFRVTIESPDKSFLPDDLYRVDLLVRAQWGLYANMMAQLLSQISSHVIIFYHRRIEADVRAKLDGPMIKHQDPSIESGSEDEIVDDSEVRSSPESDDIVSQEMPMGPGTREAPSDQEVVEPLNKHEFTRPHRGESEKLRVRPGVNPFVTLMAIALVALVLVGCILPSFSFDIQGLVGVAVESGRDFEEARDEHSVISIAGLLMDQARFLDTARDYIGLLSVSALLVITVLIVPIFQTIALLILWFLPLRQKSREKMEVIVEMLQAWQYMEVYMFSIIVGAWQLGDVSEFLINSYCDGLTSTFAELVFYGILTPEDGQCFRVQAAIEPATYVLIVAAVLLALLNTFVMKAVRQIQYFRDMGYLTSQELVTETVPTASEDGDAQPKEPEVNIDSITPVPVLFTDRFRWLLHSESQSQRSLFS